MFKCDRCGKEEKVVVCEHCKQGAMIYSDKDLLMPVDCNSTCHDCGGPAYQGASKPICLDEDECEGLKAEDPSDE